MKNALIKIVVSKPQTPTSASTVPPYFLCAKNHWISHRCVQTCQHQLPVRKPGCQGAFAKGHEAVDGQTNDT